MLESNLLKIIHPYSVVELAHVSNLIKLPEAQVVQKLSQMILDRKLKGILDQGRGHLIIYDRSPEDINFSRGVEIIGHLTQVVDTLSARTKALGKLHA
jgi:26S proteasome regulatory subunit N6